VGTIKDTTMFKLLHENLSMEQLRKSQNLQAIFDITLLSISTD